MELISGSKKENRGKSLFHGFVVFANNNDEISAKKHTSYEVQWEVL